MSLTELGVRLEDYAQITGQGVIDELLVVADRVRGRRLQHINSTAVGGGVAELLTRILPMLDDLGIETQWDVIHGNDAFFQATKALHNALHGKPERITAPMLDCYRATIEANLARMKFCEDTVWIHDPQPAGLVKIRGQVGRRWVWRCHIDISSPQAEAWRFLRPMVELYDASIFSMPDFTQRLEIPQYLVAPSIDPLSDKNRELGQSEIDRVVQRYGLDPGRPILIQVSRFDRLKDPLGVIAAYRMIRKKADCQLVLAGGGASDDPEGAEVLRDVRTAAEDDPDLHILELPPFSDLEINALVRASTIVFQKSLKEGFGLTVTEALWKRKPVIGGAVGGIRLQVIDGITGYLVHSSEGLAQRALKLLSDAALRRRMGENGHLHVKQNFLVTRHVKDYMLLLLAMEHPDEDVVYMG